MPRAPDELTRQEKEPEVSETPKLDEVAAQVLQEPQHKGRQGEAFVYDVHRMSVLGKSPKEARTRIRAALEPGFYIRQSGKKKVRSPHQFGRCYLLPGADYMDHTIACIAMPKRSEYDGVCRLCPRDGVRDGEDSRWCPPRPRLKVPPELTKSTVAQKYPTYGRTRVAVMTAYAGPRLAARVGPRPTVAVRLRESRCLGVCVCVCVCAVFVSVPWWLLSCFCGACVGVAAARQNQRRRSSMLSAHQMAHTGVAAHSSPPGAGAEVRTVEMDRGPVVVCELMNPVPFFYHALAPYIGA